MKINITLYKHTLKNDINKILNKYGVNLSLTDDIYLGNSYVHNWRCECGCVFKRSWMYMKANNRVLCKRCVYNIKNNYENISDVHINRSMSKDDINSILSEWICLEDDKYINANHKHKWKCKCGNIIIKSWDKLKQYPSNSKCRECKIDEIKKQHATLASKRHGYEYINSYLSGDIMPIDNKVANDTYFEVVHKYCGSQYTIKYANFLISEHECSKCCGSYEKSFAYHIEVELGEPLDKYWDFEKNIVNPYHISRSMNKPKVWIKCQNEEVNELNGLMKKDYHGSYEISCNKFTSGKRCSHCKPGGVNPKVHPYDSFGYHNFDKVMSWHPDNKISPFRVANQSNKKYRFVCEECMTEFNTHICNIHTQNSWCPKCSMSEGEKLIAKWLRYNGVEYEYEKEYDGLLGVNNGNLRYDFYLPQYDLLIEYQGRQHGEYIPGFHESYQVYLNQMEHDRRKREYAEKHDIRLFEIWEFDKNNIEELLDKEIIAINPSN